MKGKKIRADLDNGTDKMCGNEVRSVVPNEMRCKLSRGDKNKAQRWRSAINLRVSGSVCREQICHVPNRLNKSHVIVYKNKGILYFAITKGIAKIVLQRVVGSPKVSSMFVATNESRAQADEVVTHACY